MRLLLPAAPAAPAAAEAMTPTQCRRTGRGLPGSCWDFPCRDAVGSGSGRDDGHGADVKMLQGCRDVQCNCVQEAGSDMLVMAGQNLVAAVNSRGSADTCYGYAAAADVAAYSGDIGPCAHLGLDPAPRTHMVVYYGF